VTITGTTGRSAVISDDIGTAINTKHLCCMTLDRNVVEPEFLAHALHCDPDVVHQIEGENRGAIMSGLNMGIIRGLRVQVPPLPVQQKFVTLLNQLRVVEMCIRDSSEGRSRKSRRRFRTAGCSALVFPSQVYFRTSFGRYQSGSRESGLAYKSLVIWRARRDSNPRPAGSKPQVHVETAT